MKNLMTLSLYEQVAEVCKVESRTNDCDYISKLDKRQFKQHTVPMNKFHNKLDEDHNTTDD